MANNNETTTKFKVDISELKSAMQTARKEVALANSEFKAISSGMDNWNKSTDGISAKLKQLDSNLKSQKTVLSEYEKTLEKVKAEYGENSKEAMEYQTKLNNQKAVVNRTEAEIKKYEKSLADIKNESNRSKTAMEELSDTIDNQEKELKTLKDAYGNAVLEYGKGSKEANALAKKIRELSGEINDNKSSMKEASETSADLSENVEDVADSAEEAGEGFTVMKGALASLVADGIRLAFDALKDLASAVVEVGSGFSSSMSEVQAISGASAEELEQLEATAREFGATTVFSASEAADALKYMALAGWSVEESTSALGGVLNLAAASGMELAQASDMVTDYLSAFGMEAKDSAYFADMLAYAQGNSNTSAEQLGEAYKNSAANLNAAGQDVETVTALLASMANQGLKGSEAGTALSAMMRDLTAKMKDGKIMIGDTAVTVMDANGNYRDMTEILKDVEGATNGMGDAERATALSSTFTADSIKGLNLILNEGVDKSAGFEEALRGAGGTAEEMSAIMNDNLAGDVKSFQSALEELALKVYDALEPALRDVIAFVQDLANQFNEWLSDPSNKQAIDDLGAKLSEFVTGTLTNVKEFIQWFIEHKDGVIAGVAGIGAAFVAWNVVSMIQGIVKAIKAFQLANEGATIAQWALNVAMSANPIGLIIAAVVGLVAAFVVLWNKSETFRNFWINLWENVKTVVSTGVQAIVNFFTVTIPNAFNSVVEWIKANWPSILLFLINPFAGLFKYFYDNNSKFHEFVDNAINAIKQLPAKIWTWLVNTITKVTMWNAQMIANAIEAGTNFVNNIVNFFSQLPAKLWTWLVNVITKVTTWNANMINKAKEAGQNFINKVIEFISQLPDKIWTWLTNVISKVTTWVTNMKTKATEAGKDFVNNVIDFISQLPTKIATQFTNVITKVTTFVSDMKTKATEAGKGFFNNLVDEVKGLPDKFKSIGSDIVNGIWNGISAGWEWLTGKVKDLADGLVSGVKSVLKIESPSKTFRDEVGKWIPAGIGVGIEANADSALKSMKNLSTDLVATARGGLTNASSNLNSSGSAVGGVVNNFYQTNNSPKPLSRLEIYRQSKNLLGYAGGV